MSTPTFDPAGHPRGGDGQFTTTPRDEADVALHAELDADYAKVNAASQAVAALLPGAVVSDEGGGPCIWFGSRTDNGYGDCAYALTRGEAGGEPDTHQWKFATEDVGTPYPPGYYVDANESELTIESDPAEVAAWIRTQVAQYGSPPIRATEGP